MIGTIEAVTKQGRGVAMRTSGRSVGSGASIVGAAGAAVTSTAASICCIGPAGIALLGVNGAIVAAGLKPYRAYLLGVSLALIVAAFWLTYGRVPRRRGECTVPFGRARRVVLWASGALWIIAVAIQFAADRYWF